MGLEAARCPINQVRKGGGGLRRLDLQGVTLPLTDKYANIDTNKDTNTNTYENTNTKRQSTCGYHSICKV